MLIENSYVEVQNLVIQTHIGAGQHGEVERKSIQNLEIDIKAFFDASKPSQSDQLENTVDYVQLVSIAQSIASKHPRRLMENLAYNIAQEIFSYSTLINSLHIALKKKSTASPQHHYQFSSMYQKSTQ